MRALLQFCVWFVTNCQSGYLCAFPSPCSSTLTISGRRWAGSLGLSRYNRTFLPYLLLMTSSRDDKISWTGGTVEDNKYNRSHLCRHWMPWILIWPHDVTLTDSTACLTSLVSSTQSNMARRTRWPYSPCEQVAVSQWEFGSSRLLLSDWADLWNLIHLFSHMNLNTISKFLLNSTATAGFWKLPSISVSVTDM